MNGRVIFARPNGLQYGHLALEILMALAYARAEDAAVCLLPVGRPVNKALVDIESETVKISKPSGWQHLWLHSQWWFTRLPRRWNRQRDAALEALYHESGKELSRHMLKSNISAVLRSQLRTLRKWLAIREKHTRARCERAWPYLRRRLIATPLPVALRETVRQSACARAAELGIAPDARLVTIHAREHGFKRGREVHDKHRRQGKEHPRDDTSRNAYIESYLPAIEYLAQQGFTIVRIGDPSMTPFVHPAVVDLATSPQRTEAVEVDCLLRSTFLMSGEAGPVGVSYLTNTPVLNINVTDPIGSYPIRRTGLFLTKRVTERATGRILSCWDLLDPDYLKHLRNTKRFKYEDNSSKEIVSAVHEMLELITTPPPETMRQQEYRDRATTVAEEFGAHVTYLRKWGSDDGFLGYGRIAQVCLARTDES